jgi:hypothetical protein
MPAHAWATLIRKPVNDFAWMSIAHGGQVRPGSLQQVPTSNHTSAQRAQEQNRYECPKHPFRGLQLSLVPQSCYFSELKNKIAMTAPRIPMGTRVTA